MKQTLLEIVQDILSDMDSDEVNSLSDTFEAGQIATIVKNAFNAMISTRNWPHLRQLTSLISSNNADLPTHMKLPEDIKELEYINYNVGEGPLDSKREYRLIRYMEPEEFLFRSNALDSTKEDVVIVNDPSGIEVLIQNNKKPEYWTSFDDEWIVFDSFDSTVSSTIEESRVQAMAYRSPQFIMADDYVPDLPSEAFPALLSKARSMAMYWIKQVTDELSEAERKRQQTWLSRKAWQARGGFSYPDYGRRSAKRGGPSVPLDKSPGIKR